MSDVPKLHPAVQSILDFDFAAERKRREEAAQVKRAEDMAVFLAGPDLPSTVPCMRWEECHENRWVVPTTSSVLCRYHTLEVLRGERRAPPLRVRRDYSSLSRKTFLVEDLPVIDWQWAEPKKEPDDG